MGDLPKPVPPRPGQGQYQAYLQPSGGDNYNSYLNQVNSSPNQVNGSPNQANGYTNQANSNASGRRYKPESTILQFSNWYTKDIFSTITSVIDTAKSVTELIDNLKLAMKNSFKTGFSMYNQAGQVTSMFGEIWHAVYIFRLFQWLHSRLKKLLGCPGFDETEADLIWNKAVAAVTPTEVKPDGFPWLMLSIIGVAIALLYFINKIIYSKFQEAIDPKCWDSTGYAARVIQSFEAIAENEMSIKINDEIIVAPTYIQSMMNISTSGWCFAVSNDKYGIIPINHVVFILNEKKNLDEKTENDNKDEKTENDNKENSKRNDENKNKTIKNDEVKEKKK